MPQTAIEILEQAMNAEFTDGNFAKAIALYESAAQAYIEEGSPADAEVCQHMAEIAKQDNP